MTQTSFPSPKSASLTPLRITLQAEDAAIGLLCIVLYAQTPHSWWLFAALILAPDLFMLGYLAGNRIGAFCYNVGHSYLTPLALAALGFATDTAPAFGIALIWGAHIGFDRAIGYGLKYSDGFKATHLSRL